MRTLFIGEDSGNHLNNFLWALNLDSGQPTRLLSVPTGGEHTDLQVVTNLCSHSYRPAIILPQSQFVRG